MTTSSDCVSIGELLGAYALDAVDAGEAARIAAHVDDCPRCAHELDRHRETIGLLASAGGEAPAGVWEAIAGRIAGGSAPSAPPGVPRLGAARLGRRPRWRTAVAVAGAAAAVAAAALLGVQTARVDDLDHRVNQLSAASRQTGGLEGVAAALVDPSGRHLVLASTQNAATARGLLVVLPSGTAYLVGSTLPALPSASTYQLWSLVAGRPISVGLLGAHPSVAGFTVDPRAATSAYLVTVEPAGGVVSPTAPPVAKATV